LFPFLCFHLSDLLLTCHNWLFSKNTCHVDLKKDKTSTTPSCSGPIPAQMSRGNSVPGVIFSHTMPKMDFHYSHRFSWEKHTKLIYHMSLLYQYPQLPFHRSYKNIWKHWKITPLGSWRSWNELYLFPSELLEKNSLKW